MNLQLALQIPVTLTCNNSCGYGCLSVSAPKGLFQVLIILAIFLLFRLKFSMFIFSQGVNVIRKFEQNWFCCFWIWRDTHLGQNKCWDLDISRSGASMVWVYQKFSQSIVAEGSPGDLLKIYLELTDLQWFKNHTLLVHAGFSYTASGFLQMIF